VDGTDSELSDSAGITAVRPHCGNGCWSDDTDRSTGPGCVMPAVLADSSSPFDSCKLLHKIIITIKPQAMKPMS